MTHGDDASGSTTPEEYDRVTDTRFAYRRLGGPWLLALVLVPLVLAALLGALRGDKIEADLQDRSLVALHAAGLDGASVQFDGRDATLSAATGSGLSTADLGTAVAVVEKVDGVGDVLSDPESDSRGTAWLVGQLWFLLLIAFFLGSIVTWLVARFTLPFEDALETETGLVSEGLL
jgi:hypothetical protein